MARILLIDDCEHHRAVVETMLARQGHAVTSIDNGRDGVARFDAEPFDAVVTDIMMPGMDGLEVLRALRRRCWRVPVIAITGGPGEPWLNSAARALGATTILHKPFRTEALFRALGIPASLLPLDV